jgi:hypothetical protein
MNVGRLLRTVSRLHPLQVVARPPQAAMGLLLRDVPGGLAPRARTAWPPAAPGMRAFAESERLRGRERLARLPAGSRLRAYEENYGLELGAGDERGLHETWRTHTAVEPYPASVRARRIAMAMRLGASGLEAELARAARAVMLRPELHLLGNHVLENGFGLACAGAAAQGAEADAWWKAGRALLGWQLPAQFLEDGGHIERSASYHLWLVGALLETLEIADASGRKAPASWGDVAARALGWARAVRAPDGTYPLFNDASLDAAPHIDEISRLAEAAHMHPVASRLDATGWVCAAAGDAWLAVDAGPDAEGWQPGHAHADGLSFELWIDGERAVVDYGVGSYENDEGRRLTRATASHSTVQLAGRDSCEVWGAFRTGRRGRGHLRAIDTQKGAVRIELEHDGYAWMKGSPVHVRVMELDASSLRLTDRIEAGTGADGLEMVSRLRVNHAGRGRVKGLTDVRLREGPWHLRHGEAREARVFEQQSLVGRDSGIGWRMTW